MAVVVVTDICIIHDGNMNSKTLFFFLQNSVSHNLLFTSAVSVYVYVCVIVLIDAPVLRLTLQ